ncbi:response regulator [Marinobacter persicus]|nr:response regulator [Marinobacter persicus]
MNEMYIHILIAEDDPDDRLLLEDAFQEACPNCRLDFVSNGLELLDYLQAPSLQQLPDLLLLDLNMPFKDGRQALKELRATPAFTGLPIVIMTTSNNDDDRQACLAAGADDYLVKPNRFRALLTLVQSLENYWTRHD